jgi:hypothetical protein
LEISFSRVFFFEKSLGYQVFLMCTKMLHEKMQSLRPVLGCLFSFRSGVVLLCGGLDI